MARAPRPSYDRLARAPLPTTEIVFTLCACYALHSDFNQGLIRYGLSRRACALGSRERMHVALGVNDYSEISGRIIELTDVKSPQGLIEKLKMVPRLADLGKMFPKIVKDGPCKENILREGEFSLFNLPIIKCWPEDGGRFITMPLVFTRNPLTGRRNCGMYRMQVYDERTTGMHWQIHKQGAQHLRNLKRQGGGRLEVAVAIGADPITVFAAIMPLPDEIDEMMVAGFLRGRPVEMVKGETVDVEVPANAEIVLEGYLDPAETSTEGPFGEFAGVLSAAIRVATSPRVT